MSTPTIEDVKNNLQDRPLLICDVDEVALQFLTPFQAFLRAQGNELRSDSFSLHGNIYDTKSNQAVEKKHVNRLIDDYFDNQLDWQKPAEFASETLNRLSEHLDIVFLTAMPPDHFHKRRSLLNKFDMPHALIATEDAKGPLIKSLHHKREHGLFFIDDMIYNLRSAAEHMPNAHLISIMDNQEFKAISPKLDAGIFDANTWLDIENYIRQHI